MKSGRHRYSGRWRWLWLRSGCSALYRTRRRSGQNEFGIRIAWGAQRDHLFRIVFASTVVSVAPGIAAGLALTLALNTMPGQWTKVNSTILRLAGTLLPVMVPVLACAIRAWRGSQVDPVIALRFQ